MEGLGRALDTKAVARANDHEKPRVVCEGCSMNEVKYPASREDRYRDYPKGNPIQQKLQFG